MRNWFQAGWIPLAVAIAALMLMAAPARADEAAKLREYFEVTKLRTSLESIGDEILTGLERLPADAMQDVRKEDVVALVRSHFDADGLEMDILSRMQGKASEAQIDEVTAFYRTDLGQKLISMETAATGTEASNAIDVEGPEIYRHLQENDPERLEIYARIERSVQFENMMLTMMMNMTYALISGMAGSPAMPQALTDDQIIDIVNAQAQKFRPMITEHLKSYFAYTYRDATNDQLDRYATFAETEAGRAVNTAMVRAMSDAIVNRMRAFGHGLMVLRGVRRT